MTKVIFIHGNGGATANDAWIPSVADELEKVGIEVIANTFPDNYVAKAASWLPHIERLGADKSTILVGHSSGALAAMRYAESHELLGSVLVAAAHTDLDDANEKASGYFDSPWKWNQIRANQKWIIQLASSDDPYIPLDEQYFVRDKLQSEFYEFDNRGHFLGNTFPELVKIIINKLQS